MSRLSRPAAPKSLIVLFTALSRASVAVGVLGKCAECASIFFSTYGAFRSVSGFGGVWGSQGCKGDAPRNVPNVRLVSLAPTAHFALWLISAALGELAHV
jgi:hypothetical protein